MTIRPRGAARSARLPVTQEIVGSNPIGDAGQDSTVRKPAKRRSSNLRECLWVRLPSVLLANRTCVGWALAGPAGCKPAVRKGSGGSTPSRRTPTRFVHGAVRCWFCSEAFNLANAGSIPVRVAVLARCDVGFTVRPSTWPTRVRFPSESLDAAKWWNLVDTRRSEGRARRGVRVQVSPWLLTERLQVGRDPTGFHTAGVPGSIPGPATCGWASAHSGLISLDCRCATPGPAT